MQTPPAYTLTCLIHDGTYAALYRGKDGEGNPVAIKLLKREYPTPEEIARLQHEYRIIRDIDSPFVIKAYSLETYGAGLALILEDGGEEALDAVLARGRMDTSAALDVMLSVAKALEAVHERRILHKDIKPGNILQNRETGQTKLADFGIATRLAREAPQAQSREGFAGTLAYMSPEQTGRTSRFIDSRTDLYSLGVTLYQALTGSLPFPTDDMMDLVHGHLARVPPTPRERTPDVPEVVSAIVMKLLAKGPEDRYQTAAGLAADLEECLRRAEATGTIAPFPLGQRDAPRTLRVPQRLYGRDREVASLLIALERAAAGGAELLLVSGQSGVGKSALVREIHRSIGGHGGYFGTGKFDQLARDVPYSAVAAALGDLVHQLLLIEPDEALARWKRAILGAVRANGKVLTDVIPGLQLILGEQPDVAELPPAAAQNRFTLVFQDFLGVFAAARRPLVLFLEDLQWADTASLHLLELLMTGPERGYLLVIGTYRSSEVDAAHPLRKTLASIAGSSAISAIELGPLGPADVRRFVADALGDDLERVAPLADVVFEKTGGSPFFVLQFLTALQRDELLTTPGGASAFQWDLAQIRARMATDNVVSFMMGRLQRLTQASQRALSLAACIGHVFGLQTLAVIREAEPAAVAGELWAALEEGIVVPLDHEYRFFDSPEHPPQGEFSVSFRFAHDRIQQVAYALIDEGERAAVHLRIGRLLLANEGGAPRDSLFEITSHLNLGAALIADRGERLRLARLNLEAGKRAMAASAHPVAAGYFARGVAVLDEASWDDAYETVFALHMDWAQCEAQMGEHAIVETLQDVLLARARTDVERAQVLERRLNLYSAQGRHRDAISAGLAALRILGIDVHDSEDRWAAALDAEMAAVSVNLAGRRLEELASAPPMTDSRVRAAMTILMSTASPALGLSQPLHHWIAAKAVNLSLAHGTTDASPRAYALYGVVLTVFMVRPEEGYAFGKLSLALHEKLGVQSGTAMFSTLFISSAFYSAPYRALIPYLERGTEAGLASGEFLFLSYCRSHITLFLVALGEPLPALKEELARSFAIIRRTKVGSTEAILTFSRQMVENLSGRTVGRLSLSDETFDEESFAAKVDRAGFMVALCWYLTIKGELLYLYEEHASAVETLTRARAGVSLGFEPDMRYYLGLSILAVLPSSSEEEKRRLRPLLASCVDDVALYARSCADNFLQKLLLLQAEQARVDGDVPRAMELYDEAIAAARDNDWPRDIALAHELAAKFYRGLGRTRIARVYMIEAHHHYQRWGAVAKASHLVEAYPELMQLAPVKLEATAAARPLTTATTTGDAMQFDVAALIRAAETISGEIVFDSLLARLMRVVVENAGAEWGAFLLKLDGSGGLAVAATVTGGDETAVFSPPAPLELDERFCPSIVQYTTRTHKTVVLHNAAQAIEFQHDPRMKARQPKSVLCMPVLRQGELRGILYLENNLAAGAFTDDRVELLRVLCGQLAISIENATLYANLEQKVKERTRELREAQERLLKLERNAAEVEMAGGFAHEMRNALVAASLCLQAAFPEPGKSLCVNNSSALVEILREILPEIPAEVRARIVPLFQEINRNEVRLNQMLLSVEGSVSRGLQVTRLILEYSQVSASLPGDGEIEVRRVVDSVVSELAEELSSSGVAVAVSISPTRTLSAQEGHLTRIVRSLVTNARDAMESADRRELRIDEAEEDGRWALRVTDTGEGIAPEHRERLFAPFFSTRPATRVGLGLAMVEKLVSLYGGSVRFESEVGRGTTFTVAFPTRPE